MSNLLSYKNYNGTVEYSKEDNCLFGKVVGIKSLLSCEGDSVQELEKDFWKIVRNGMWSLNSHTREHLMLGSAQSFIEILLFMQLNMERV